MSSAAPLPNSVEESVAVRVHRFAFYFEDDLVSAVLRSRPLCVYLTVDSRVIFALLPNTSRILFGQYSAPFKITGFARLILSTDA